MAQGAALCSQWVRLFTRYMSLEDPSSAAAVNSRRELEKNPAFEYVMCKWNHFNIPGLQGLAQTIVGATWSAQHDRLHRLYEIGHTQLLSYVVFWYLKKTLACQAPLPQTLCPLPLSRWVVHCMAKTYNCTMFFQHPVDPPQHALDRLHQLADCCTHPHEAELAVILAVMVMDWPVVRQVLVRHIASITFLERLVIAMNRTLWVPLEVEKFTEAMFKGRYWRDATTMANNLLDVFFRYGEWLVYTAVETHLWTSVKQFILLNPHLNEETVNFVLHQVVEEDEHDWRFIKAFLPRCTHKNVLYSIFETATTSDHLDISRDVLQCLRRHPAQPAVISVFVLLVVLMPHKNIAVTLLTLSARFGMSTHWVFSFSKANTEEFIDSLTGLLLKIGLITYNDCFLNLPQFISDDNHYRDQLLADLANEGTRPLADVCRLVVSHRLGFRPGRDDILKSLLPGLPGHLKWLLRFKDL